MLKQYLIGALHISAVLIFFHCNSSAQGGWRQWNVFLRDGTQLEANPLGMNEAGRFTRGMGAEPGIERLKIAYLAIARRELPPLPKGEFDKDMVMLVDGTRAFGAVAFKNLKFSEGVLLQNGKQISTENIAYIKFARPIKKTKAGKRRS